MKFLSKIVLLAASLFGMAMSACLMLALLGIEPLAGMANYYLQRTVSVICIGVFSALSFLLFFALLIVAIALRGKPKDMEFSKDKGHLRFSRQSIESAVYHSFSGIEGIANARVRVKIKRSAEQSRVLVRLSVTDGRFLLNLSERVQHCIEDTLRDSLGIEVAAIHVRVDKLTPSSAPAAETIRRDDT